MHLKTIFGTRLKENELMSKHTNFRIGGPARFYVEAQSAEEIMRAFEAARTDGVRVIVHGGGSNTLVADTGVDALVLVPALRDVAIEGMQVIAGAGVPSGLLARKTAEAGLAGLEWMISLPGTVGGAVRGNAGCFGGETKDHLASVSLYKPAEGVIVSLSAAELFLRYRHSIFKEPSGKDWVVLSATFMLEWGNAEELKKQLDEHVASRKASQPTNVGSAGCIFKNYEVKDDAELARLQEHFHLPESMLASRRIGAGWIIDQLDLKGTAVGGAKVSNVHGNFLVNEGKATADDIMQLIALLKSRVRNALGIQLQEEIQFLI
ncbi:UDP-N-acetylmuramate dehydrogenase [Candidatus Uhrbacteria bacterium]|nr:UDP-N-acetylmuramate dehydrogenase [Candidatus Uhrbacteria bacterium]